MLNIADNDLYNFSMQSAILKLFPDVCARYRLIFRGDKPKLPSNFIHRLTGHLDFTAAATMHEDICDFLRRECRFLDSGYLHFLKNYRLTRYPVVGIEDLGLGKFELEVEGLWWDTVLWDIPILSTISELYYSMSGIEPDLAYAGAQMYEKLDLIRRSGIKVADFGTRRRFSLGLHRRLLSRLGRSLIGTSNVLLAKELGLRPIGTMAHEWIQAHAIIYGYSCANRMAMENWATVYKGGLGIALGDTYTTWRFLKEFDGDLARLYDGVRQDSGDPIEVGESILRHYCDLGIDPMTKTIVFSDSLTVPRAVEVADHFEGRINTAFGIGTNLTNDVGADPLRAVIKLVALRPDGGHWKPAVKLSDDPAKASGDPDEIETCRRALGIE